MNEREERERWKKAIPRDNIPDSLETVVCEKHFPPGYATVKAGGRERPKDPPSIFPGIPSSMIPTPPPVPRAAKRAFAAVKFGRLDRPW